MSAADVIALAADQQEMVDAMIEHFNADHSDTVLFVARYGGACREASDAEIMHVGESAVTFEVTVDRSRHLTQMAYPDGAMVTASDPTVGITAADVQAVVFGCLQSARDMAGQTVPLTSIELEVANRSSLPTSHAVVSTVRSLTPNLREVVLEGDFEGVEVLGGDDFVYLIVAPPGRSDDFLSHYSMSDYMDASRDQRPPAAYYTVRHLDRAAGRMTLWMVVHDDAAGVGAWSKRCAVGDRVALWGPRRGTRVSFDRAVYLFVTDESGFAAVANLVRQTPIGSRVVVIAETIDEHHTIDLGFDTRWVFRGDREPGVGTAMLDTVRALDPGERPIVFAAGESRQMTAIRKYVRNELVIPSCDVSATGYWRRRA